MAASAIHCYRILCCLRPMSSGADRRVTNYTGGCVVGRWFGYVWCAMRWMAVCAACPTDAFGRVSVSWSLREGGEQLPDASRALWLRGFGRVHCVPGLITVLCDLIDRISLRVSLCVRSTSERSAFNNEIPRRLHYLSSQQDLWEALLHDRVRSMRARV